MLIQKYLINKSLLDLQKEHGIYASFNKNGEYASFNYDMIESKDSDLLAQECRGIILSSIDGEPYQPNIINGKKTYEHVIMGDTKVLCFGIKRFFNLGQGSASNIDWSDLKLSILEKLDGTLIQVWMNPFNNIWNVSTRSCPDADILMDNGLFTFRTLFEKALHDTTGFNFNELTSFLNPNFTYCFELCSPLNRIVVNYPNNMVTLIAVRDMVSMKEFDPRSIEQDLPVSIPIVQTYSYTSMQDLLDWVSAQNPIEHEGVVVRDGNFNRIKIKNAQYVVYNKCRDNLATSERNCLALILAERDDDVVPFMPEEIVKNIQKIKIGLKAAIKKYDDIYQICKNDAEMILANDKKTFAILITKNKDLWTAPLFQIYDNKASNMKDFIAKNRKEGTWSDGFLYKLLDLSKKYIN